MATGLSPIQGIRPNVRRVHRFRR